MGISIWQLLLVLLIVFVVFGAGKLPRVMGDLGKGVRSLRQGLKGEDEQGETKERETQTPAPMLTQEHQQEKDKANQA